MRFRLGGESTDVAVAVLRFLLNKISYLVTSGHLHHRIATALGTRNLPSSQFMTSLDRFETRASSSASSRNKSQAEASCRGPGARRRQIHLDHDLQYQI